MIRQGSPTENFVYMMRLMVFLTATESLKAFEPQAKTNCYATLRVSAVPTMLPEEPPLVRMAAEELNIKFTPIAGNHALG